MRFDDWMTKTTEKFMSYDMCGYRWGQCVMNELPYRIYDSVTGDLMLDCYYDDDKATACLQFAELVWDADTDEEFELARRLVVGA